MFAQILSRKSVQIFFKSTRPIKNGIFSVYTYWILTPGSLSSSVPACAVQQNFLLHTDC